MIQATTYYREQHSYEKHHSHLLIQWWSSYTCIILSRHATYSPEEVLVSLWIRELHYVNNSSAKKRMIQATTYYGEQHSYEKHHSHLLIQWWSSYPCTILSRHAAYSSKEVLVSLWIRELHYVNNSSAKKRMILLGSEARKALQIFVQNNDCSGRC